MLNVNKARILLLGGMSRTRIARRQHVRAETIYQALPVTDLDKMRAGQAVSIGGILAKRCRVCGVTKMLEKFYVDDTASGCGPNCLSCGNRPVPR